MDDKTEELKDIFMDVSDEETVTETQAETRGSLTDVDEETVDERVRDLVERMRDRYDFETDLTLAEYVTVARGFYDGRDDADIAEDVGADADTVFAARMDLHLLGDDDTDTPFDRAEFREHTDDPDSVLAETFGVSEADIRRYRRVVAAEDAARRASHRYQDEFDELLADADLASPITESMQEDGLDDATEGLESNVSF